MSEIKYAEKGMTCPLCLAEWNGKRWYSTSFERVLQNQKRLYMERDRLRKTLEKIAKERMGGK